MANEATVTSDASRKDLIWSVGLKFGIGAFVLLMLMLWFTVARSYGGRWEGPLELSTQFGIPKAERDAGVVPVTTNRGWDGQHYYHLANDPFLLADDTAEHIDWPSYRAQRIGPPFIAYVLTKASGRAIVSPFLFHLVQVLLTSVGFGILAAWLAGRDLSPWLATIWLCSGGAIHSLIYGLPDSPADAMFIVAAVGIMTRRLELYLPAALLLVFCRESYAVFAAAVFCLTVFNRINWIRPTQWITRASLVMLPGVALLAWMGYVSYRLKLPLFHASKLNEWGTLVDWPFFAPLWQWAQFIDMGDSKQIFAMSVAVLTLLIVGKYLLDNAKDIPFAAASFPYIVLMSMTGLCVWGGWAGFLRMLGAIVIMGIFLLPKVPDKLLRITLIVNIVVALYFTVREDFTKKQPQAPLTPIELQSAMTPPSTGLSLSFVRDFARYRK